MAAGGFAAGYVAPHGLAPPRAGTIIITNAYLLCDIVPDLSQMLAMLKFDLHNNIPGLITTAAPLRVRNCLDLYMLILEYTYQS